MIASVSNRVKWVASLMLLVWAGISWAAPANDVRMLIDISGSMKANDPNNLRVPAVELMTDLLPDGAKAGVWTFGQEVNMLVPYGPVNPQWRQRARDEIKKINSVGLYTNIGAVLDKASFDRNDAASDSPRNLIMLTDGMVDISKDRAEDEAEKQRILNQQLPQLAQSGYQLHTIALSEKSDRELLETLAIESGGLSSQAGTADELTKLFLKALEQSAPADEVPLKDNRFLIDSSVDEFTLLAFKSHPDDKVQLQSPSEAIIDRNNPGEGVRWHAAASYELITIPQPYEGEWRLLSEEAPENRVSVVSDLKMEVSRLASNAYLGERLDLQASFLEAGSPMTDAGFLALIKTTVEIRDGENELVSRLDAPRMDAAQGGFGFTLPSFPEAGSYEISVQADGETFKREMRQQVSVREPFQFSADLISGQGPDRFDVRVIPRTQSIDRAASEVFARIRKPDGTKQLRGVELDADGRKWSFPIEALTRGEYQVSLKVSAVTSGGKQFDVKADPLVLRYPEGGSVKTDGVADLESEDVPAPIVTEPPVANEPASPEAEQPLPPPVEPQSKLEEAPVAPETPKQEAQEEAKEEDQKEVEEEVPEEESRLWLYIALGLGNLLVIAGLVFVYLKFIRDPKPAPEPEADDDEDDDER
ncbi:VWA domain-containing protein [Aestuariirhabdus sp. LZHN29]|uniref:VWA domain-containing protein n=1 Tax=Aestuariirhabdus sp. LZHN29 TaxID=3417462 RepID=UPI003CF45C26